MTRAVQWVAKLAALFLLAVVAPGLKALAQPATGSTIPGGQWPTTASVKPVGATGDFVTRLDATFGRTRPDATVRNKADLDRIAYYRFIYGDSTTTGDGTDGLYGNYRSRHRDYPDGDPRALHVFTADALVLKAHCGLETARRSDCGEGNIESGIVRFALPVRPGSYVEMRCQMPAAMYAWPAFWLNPGEQYSSAVLGAKAKVGPLDWPPEIDVFDQFGFDGVPVGRAMPSGALGGDAEKAAGNPHDTYRDPQWGDKWYYQPPVDLAADFHVHALDWGTDNTLRFLLDGRVYREMHFEWKSKGHAPAHLIASLQVGAKFNDLSGIQDQGGIRDGWDWPISYIRVWTRAKTPVLQR